MSACTGGEVAKLGLRLVVGLKAEFAIRLLEARKEALFDGAEDSARRAVLEQHEMTLLAGGDALVRLASHRHQQVWEATAPRSTPKPPGDAPVDDNYLELPERSEGEEVVWDFAATGPTLRRHPLAVLRPTLAAKGWKTAAKLHDLPAGRLATACGGETLRQQPGAAKGTMFVSPATLEACASSSGPGSKLVCALPC